MFYYKGLFFMEVYGLHHEILKHINKNKNHHKCTLRVNILVINKFLGETFK